jgi:hypothetical protein
LEGQSIWAKVMAGDAAKSKAAINAVRRGDTDTAVTGSGSGNGNKDTLMSGNKGAVTFDRFASFVDACVGVDVAAVKLPFGGDGNGGGFNDGQNDLIKTGKDACDAFIRSNRRAREQLALERRFVAFERDYHTNMPVERTCDGFLGSPLGGDKCGVDETVNDLMMEGRGRGEGNIKGVTLAWELCAAAVVGAVVALAAVHCVRGRKIKDAAAHPNNDFSRL